MSENENAPNLTHIFMIGCSLLACIILLAGLMILAAIYRTELPVFGSYFSTPTATATATPSKTAIPHVLIEPESKDIVVFNEDFTTNLNDWSSYYRNQKVEVKDGKLFLESFHTSNTGIAKCYCKEITSNEFANHYYYQVDLSTDRLVYESYGLVFSLADEGFYIFTLTGGGKSYSLDKRSAERWTNLEKSSSQVINAYPASNTLSVSFNNGNITLYINGKQVTQYQDENPIKKGEIGMYVDGGNFKLIADHLFAYTIK